MDKQAIVKLFLDKGFQIDPVLLEHLLKNQEYIDVLLGKLHELRDKTILTIEDLPVKEKVKVLKKYTLEPGKYTTNNVVQILKDRYDKLSQLLLKRLDLIKVLSINKINQRVKSFSIIGLVRDKNEDKRSIVVEDATGEIEVFFPEELEKEFQTIFLDEVLGICCEQTEERLFAQKIIYPDIPLKREIKRTAEDCYCLFISNIKMDSDKFNRKYFLKFLEWLKEWRKKNLIIFVLGNISSKAEDVENFLREISYRNTYLLKSKDDVNTELFILTDPSLIEIEGVKIFLNNTYPFQKYIERSGVPVEHICLLLIKKRHLDPTLDLERLSVKDEFLLEQVPDIFVCGSSENPSSINYKGVSILSCGNFIDKPIFHMVNLKTREIFKVDFT